MALLYFNSLPANRVSNGYLPLPQQRVVNSVMNFKQTLSAQMNQTIEDSKRKMRDLEEGDIESFTDDMFHQFNKSVLKGSDDLKALVKSNMPTKPCYDDFLNEADFKKEMKGYEIKMVEYKEFLGWISHILSRLTNWMNDLWEKLKAFVKSLWNWIKSKVQDLAEKVAEFINRLEEELSKLGEYLFGGEVFQ